MKKGFTLIELLAVIVILAIIALIAVPKVLNLIKDAKVESIEKSQELYLSAVENAVWTYSLNSKFPDTICEVLDGGNLSCDDLSLPNPFEIDISNREQIKGGATIIFENREMQYFPPSEIVSIPSKSTKTMSRQYGTVDIKFLRGKSYIEGKANAPIIDKNNMVPVNYDFVNDVWAVTDEKNWDYNYDLEEKKWANVMLKDLLVVEGMTNSEVKAASIDELKGKVVTTEGSMFVWIPRYAYKLTYYKDANRTIPIGYLDARGIVDLEGKTPKDLQEPNISIAVGDEYYRPHPAFESDLDQGGWDKKITGLWFGKFITTQKVDNKPTVTRNKDPYSNLNITDAYLEAQNLGINGSHMAKNSEWGAMAYLAYSPYGLNGTDPEKTGNTGAFRKFNINQSANANITGIFDIDGANSHFVAAYIPNGKCEYGNSFASIDNTVNNKTESTKYATVYPYDPENNTKANNYSLSLNRVFGDSTAEVSNGPTSVPWGPHSRLGSFVSGTSCFFLRDNNAGYNYSGPKAFSGSNGKGSGGVTFKIVIITE